MGEFAVDVENGKTSPSKLLSIWDVIEKDFKKFDKQVSNLFHRSACLLSACDVPFLVELAMFVTERCLGHWMQAGWHI